MPTSLPQSRANPIHRKPPRPRLTSSHRRNLNIAEGQNISDIHEIMEHNPGVADLQRANRAFRVLSAINKVLLHAVDENVLMQETCRILTDIGGYRLSWIGLAEHDERKSVHVVTQQGFEVEYLDSIQIGWGDDEFGQGPAGTAIRTRQASYFPDALHDPRFSPWRERAHRYGCASALGLPLIIDEEAVGVLMVYGDTVGAFDEHEIAILRELADNLSFGLQVLRTRADRDRAAAAAQERINALNCLYSIADLVERPGSTLVEILQGIVRFIPPALRFPELIGARIVFQEQSFQTPNFQVTPYLQACQIVPAGGPADRLEVCYLGELSAGSKGPFQEEDLRLLRAVAERTGRIIQRDRALREWAETEQLLRLERQLAASEAREGQIRTEQKSEPSKPWMIDPTAAPVISPSWFFLLRSWRKPLAWVILLVSLLLTMAAWYAAQLQGLARVQDRFNFESREIEQRIREHLFEYESMLRGGAGLFASSADVTREEWQTYVRILQIDRHYRGIQGIGFSPRILASEKEALLRKIRQEGFPHYQIRPEGDRPEHVPIVFLEPFDARNQRAFGYDIFSEAVRRQTLETARDTGLPAATGLVTLVQETGEDIQKGFLLFMPVYRKGGSPATLEQRRQSLEGYVSAAFRMNDLIRNIVPVLQEGMEFRIFDDTRPARQTLMYSSAATGGVLEPSAHSQIAVRQSILDFAQHRWLLDFIATAEFAGEIKAGLASVILWSGILISLLLFGFFRSMTKSQTQAVELAGMLLEQEKGKARLQQEIEEHRQAQRTSERYATDLKAFNEAMVGRELRFIELKEEINTLCAELGRHPHYPEVWKGPVDMDRQPEAGGR